MTDPPCNCLASGTGTLIAGKGTFTDLSLEVLSDYPGSLTFADGDHLTSAPNPLEDAIKLQRRPEYPHCAYGRVVRRGGSAWLEYWLWYYDNPKKFLGQGRHQGDWEMVIVEVDSNGEPKSVTCSQHNAGEARRWDAVEQRDGHPLVYVAPFSHANYFEPGTHFYFPGADHPTTEGPVPAARGRRVRRLAGVARALGRHQGRPRRPPQHRRHEPDGADRPGAAVGAPLRLPRDRGGQKAGGVALPGAVVPGQGDLPAQARAPRREARRDEGDGGVRASPARPSPRPAPAAHRPLRRRHRGHAPEPGVRGRRAKRLGGARAAARPAEGGCLVYGSVFNFLGQRSDVNHVATGEAA